MPIRMIPKSVQGVLHNPHSFVVKGTSSATGFNIGLAKKGDKLDKPVVFRGGAEKDGLLSFTVRPA